MKQAEELIRSCFMPVLASIGRVTITDMVLAAAIAVVSHLARIAFAPTMGASPLRLVKTMGVS